MDQLPETPASPAPVPPDEPVMMTARTPEDLIALAPVVLGFQPEDSVVMLTFGAGAFHARIDLPRTAGDHDAVIGALLVPVVRHGLRRAAFVVFARRPPARRFVQALLRAFDDAGVAVVELLYADGRRWSRLGRGRPSPGVPYDVTSHPFAAQSVLTGQVTWSSRRALAASVSADPDRVAALRPLLGALPARVPARQRSAEEAWLVGALGAADRGAEPDDTALARLLRDLAVPGLWRAALAGQTRARSDTQAALWSAAVRSAPPGWVAGPAALLGFVAWLGGQGALAWCAVDRCLAEQPGDDRAAALAGILANAVPPSQWGGMPCPGARDPA